MHPMSTANNDMLFLVWRQIMSEMSSSSSISSLELNDNELVDKEITDFFKTLELDVVFEDGCFMNTCCSMFDHVKMNEQCFKANNDDLKSAIKNSYEFEQGIIMKSRIMNQLIQSNNSISNVYNAFAQTTDSNAFRRQRVLFMNSIYGKTYNGAAIKNINYSKLQNWVNVFHNYQFEQPVNKMLCGFVLHLLYLRLVPHERFNSAIARYLFLENKLQTGSSDLSFVPVSILLNNNVVPALDILNELYASVFDPIYDNVKASESDYYHLIVTSQMLRRMYYIIYISRLQFMSCKYYPKLRREMNKNIDFVYIFCLGHGCFPVYSTTTVRIPEQRNILNIKFVNWINSTLFDYTQHKKLLSLLQ